MRIKVAILWVSLAATTGMARAENQRVATLGRADAGKLCRAAPAWRATADRAGFC